ncbi:MAG TPA: acyl-CoA dehydrogenase family protein [Myxococcota bacterium]|nr:acyl-CoA dehydrogenase family protein [Myxococcota bacterium]
MDLELDDEQRAIAGAVEALLAKHAGAERAAALARTGAYDGELDAALASAGYQGVALAEGAGLLEAALVVHAVARAAGVCAAAAGALAVPAALGRALPGPVALVDESLPGPVRFAGDARTLVALRGDAARVLALAPGDAEPVATSYGYPMARVDAAVARRGESLGPGAAERLRAGWRLALAVEIAGTMQGALDATLGYLRERRQFGRAIASFQAVQHRLAWCAVQTEGSRWLALEAAARGAPAEACAIAAAHAAHAAKRVFAETHQLSGAIGFTREHALHVWSMRLPALRLELGGAAGHASAAARARWGARP